jgi:hypothetical protein
MKKLIFLFFIVSCLAGRAALTFVAREPFVGPGTLTSMSPGSNFTSVSGTFTKVRVGPYPAANLMTAPGWSADIRTTASVSYRGTVNLTGPVSTCGLWGTWVRIKALPSTNNYMSVLQLLDQSNNNVVMDFTINSKGVISTSPYDYGGTAPIFTSPAIVPNTWVWLAVAWQIQTGPNFPYGVRCMSMPLGGTLNVWGSADGLGALATSFSGVNVGLQTGGTGPMLRIGCPSLYSMNSFTDIAYPTDITPPVEQSNNWYVNTASGNDNNDGSTPATAWQTATKINTESQYCGMLDSNAAGPGGGDVLTIDTSGAPLVIGANTLTFATQGLKVQPVNGQTYINCQAEEILSNASFTKTAGLNNTYQTSDTQALIVAWENDKWMWHVKSASYGASASVTNPQTSVTTNYPTTGAALDAVAGSFYTDGTNLYIHPFGGTNPTTDNQVYTRSINRGNGLSAVSFIAGNYRAIGFYIRKTTLVDSGDNDFGAYCFQDGVLTGSGLSSSIEGGYFAYGDKHCFGSTGGVTGSTLLILNTECEQGHPYCAYGGQTPFVSYSGATTADNIHIYQGCSCLARSGLVGSTAGDPLGTGGDIILSHNNGSGTSFASITLNNCNFSSGSVDLGVSNSIICNNTSMAELLTNSPTNCTGCSFTNQNGNGAAVQMLTGATNLTLQSCIVRPTWVLGAAGLSGSIPTYYGLLLKGTSLVEGCTFDLSGISGDSSTYLKQGFIQRIGALNLTYRNNVYVVPSGENLPLLYNAAGSDTLTFDHNAYDLGSGTTLLRNYIAFTSSDLTFGQWQSLGEDCANSSLNANLLLQNDIPQTGSPLINAGADLGSMADFTGTVFTHRNTIGAYQEGTYLAAQSISGFPALQTLVMTGAPVNLPSTTSAGLSITYSVLSGPATIAGHVLTLNGTGTVVLTASQTGNSVYAPLSDLATLTVNSPANDTPAMPTWGLILLGALLALSAARSLRETGPLKATQEIL